MTKAELKVLKETYESMTMRDWSDPSTLVVGEHLGGANGEPAAPVLVSLPAGLT